MHRILLCSFAILLSFSVTAQTSKRYKQKKTEQTDSTATNQEQQTDTTKKVTKPKKDNKKANNKSNKTQSNPTSKSTTTKPPVAKKTPPAPKPKPMTNAEKKEAEKEAAEKEASTPKGVEAVYYQFPAEFIPVVTEFIAVKQVDNPHTKIKDDPTLRKQIIRYKNIDKGYMELQKPGDNKYTRIQMFKKSDGGMVMAVEQSDCHPYCTGTMKFYTKGGTPGATKTSTKPDAKTTNKKKGAKADTTAVAPKTETKPNAITVAGWKDVTDEYFPKLDNKYVLSKLKSRYKKEYKDLDIYNSKGYEDNEANLKKAITYSIAPDDAKIIIAEQYLPYTLYEMIWDGKKDKFEMKKVDK
jgi:hypothetical protein